jgi:hypothetical protein
LKLHKELIAAQVLGKQDKAHDDRIAKLKKQYEEAQKRRKAQKSRKAALKVAVPKADLEAALDKFDQAADDLRVLLGKPRQHKSKKGKSRLYKTRLYKSKKYQRSE